MQVNKTLLSLLFVGCFFCSCETTGNNDDGISIEFKNENYSYRLPYSNQIISQEKDERVWRNISVKKVIDLNDSLFSPIRILQKEKSIFVLDAADGFIKKIQSESGHIEKIGPGRGEGPGEVNFPFDFDIDKQGNFYLIDLRKRALIIWDSKGRPLIDYFFKFITPTTLTATEDERVLLMVGGTGLESDKLGFFQSFDLNSKELEVYSAFLTNIDHLPPIVGLETAMTGTILNDGQELLYIPKHLNHLVMFSNEGESYRVRKTIDEEHYPGIVVKENSVFGGVSTSLSSDTKTINLDGFVVDNHIIIWSKPGNIKYGSHVFDFYEKISGLYLFSIRIPELGQVAAVSFSSKFISTINSDHSISQWEYEIND